MKKLDNLTEIPSNQPLREIYFYGLKKFGCSEVIHYEYQNFIFKVSVYEKNSNGRKYVEMFDKSGTKLLEEYTIYQTFSWTEYYSFVIKHNEETESDNCIRFKKNYSGMGIEFRLEHLFKYLIVIKQIFTPAENETIINCF